MLAELRLADERSGTRYLERWRAMALAILLRGSFS
jgi:hypothetical protein